MAESISAHSVRRTLPVPQSNVSEIREADIMQLLGGPIMTEAERLYRKILRRRPKMLELAAKYGLLRARGQGW